MERPWLVPVPKVGACRQIRFFARVPDPRTGCKVGVVPLQLLVYSGAHPPSKL
jgi:hypothetical protein